MRKLISLILSVVMIVAMCIAGGTTAFASTYTGSGTEDDPYVVTTDEELYDVLWDTQYPGRTIHIRFDADIETWFIGLDSDEDLCIDLNGHTLKVNSIWQNPYGNTKLSLNNGTVEGFYEGNHGYLIWFTNFYAKNVTFRGADIPAGVTRSLSVLYTISGNFYIDGCTIIGGDYSDDAAPRWSTVNFEETGTVGVITDTRIERGSGPLNNNVRALEINGARVTDGDGNPLSSSAMNEDVVIIPPSAFAPITTNGGSRNYRVKATYQAGASADIVYSVDIAWGSMEFTYTDASEGTWNPETHGFEDIAAAAWSCDADANKITVTNHSNIAIDAALSYTSEADYSAISGSFTDEEGNETITKLKLATSLNTTVGNAPKADAFLKLDGALTVDTSSAKIGSVTVTISDRD